MTVATATLQGRVSSHPEGVSSREIRQLQQCPLFRGIRDARLQTVLQFARARAVARGGFYFRQGDRPVEICVLLRGCVQLIRLTAGDRRAILGFVMPGEPFGYENALGDIRYMMSARASDDSAALTWPAAVFVHLLTDHPELAHNGLQLMAASIEEKSDRLSELLTASVERRVARALLGLGARIGRRAERSPAVKLALAHRDLAAFVGATPYTMSRILSRWKRLRLIDSGRGWVALWPRGLAALANHARK